jgi:hypothetical protein
MRRTAGAQHMEPPQRRLSPAGHCYRQYGRIECNRNHEVVPSQPKILGEREAFFSGWQGEAQRKYFFPTILRRKRAAA